ncbi:MAG: xylulokinase, partial [Oscillochloris sp.]|nr:xylulokinase [Oscillochloris sp.]
MSRSPLLLGIDLGTSLLKLQAIDQTGQAVAEASSPLGLDIPQPGWAEQSPTRWWEALILACSDLFGRGVVAPEQVAAIGLSGQMHGAVFLDDAGEVLRPCLIWADARTVEQVAQITAHIPRADLIGITGNAPNTSFTAAKVLWVRQHEPQVYAHTRHILLPKDYLRWRLTRQLASDVSDASATLLFDLAARDWSRDLLHALAIDLDLLPPIYESAAVTGAISAEAARATGLRAGTPVVAGGGDAECSAFGLGLAGGQDGALLCSLGTSGQVFTVTDRPVIDPVGRIHSLCHVVPGRWHVMGAIMAGGVALRWLRDVLSGPKADRPIAYATLTEEAARVGIGADGLIFLPYLLGERTPHMDPHARGVFCGLRLDHGRAHLVRAVMEGVVLALCDGLAVFRELGIATREVRAVGGGAQSELWRQIQRDSFNLPVRRSLSDHGAAYGAALLAGMGVGIFASAEAAVAGLPLQECSPPDVGAVAQYRRVYEHYRALY